MTSHKLAKQCVCYSDGIEQNCSYKIAIPNFYGVKFNIYTNSRRLFNAINRFLLFFLNRSFQNYLDFYFPKVSVVYNLSFSVQEKDSENITRYLDSLEKKMRKIICGNFFIFHGSAIAKKNYYLFFIGDSKAGKSTLAVDFRQNGWRFYADDITLLEKDSYRCFIFPQFIKIRNEGLSNEQGQILKKLNIKELLLEKMIDLTDDEFKIYTDYLKKIYCVQNNFIKVKPKEFYFIFLNNSIAKKPSIYEIDKSEAVFTFFNNVYLDSCLGRKKDLVELIFKSKCYSLEKGRREDTRRLILSYLQFE